MEILASPCRSHVRFNTAPSPLTFSPNEESMGGGWGPRAVRFLYLSKVNNGQQVI